MHRPLSLHLTIREGGRWRPCRLTPRRRHHSFRLKFAAIRTRAPGAGGTRGLPGREVRSRRQPTLARPGGGPPGIRGLRQRPGFCEQLAEKTSAAGGGYLCPRGEQRGGQAGVFTAMHASRGNLARSGQDTGALTLWSQGHFMLCTVAENPWESLLCRLCLSLFAITKSKPKAFRVELKKKKERVSKDYLPFI